MKTDKIYLIVIVVCILLTALFVFYGEEIISGGVPFAFIAINESPDEGDWVQLYVEQDGSKYLIQGYIRYWDNFVDRLPHYEIFSDGTLIKTITPTGIAQIGGGVIADFSIFPVSTTFPSENDSGRIVVKFIMGGDRGDAKAFQNWKDKTGETQKLRNNEQKNITINKIQVQTTPPEPPVVESDIDTDGDGVPDDMDLCPSLVGVVEHNGCPVPEQIVNDEPPDELILDEIKAQIIFDADLCAGGLEEYCLTVEEIVDDLVETVTKPFDTNFEELDTTQDTDLTVSFVLPEPKYEITKIILTVIALSVIFTIGVFVVKFKLLHNIKI